MVRNTFFKSILMLSTTSLLVASCATAPDKIEAAYVSPLQYDPYTCEQLAQEAARVSQRAAQATGAQQQKAKRDAGAVAVGVILFWPALFFVKGKGANESEVARLKGEMETIEKVSIQKNCGFQFQGEAQASPQVAQTPVAQAEPEVIPAPSQY